VGREDRDDWGTYDEDMAETMRTLEYERDDEDEDYEEEDEEDGCPLCGRAWGYGRGCL